VLFILVMIALVGWPSSLYLWHQLRPLSRPLTPLRLSLMSASFLAAAAMSIATWRLAMRAGIEALNEPDRPVA
jgi:hypothetical protein